MLEKVLILINVDIGAEFAASIFVAKIFPLVRGRTEGSQPKQLGKDVRRADYMSNKILFGRWNKSFVT